MITLGAVEPGSPFGPMECLTRAGAPCGALMIFFHEHTYYILEPVMQTFRKLFAVIALAAGAFVTGGCSSDYKPDSYNRQRPDVTQLDPEDRGLQSPEVIEASEKVANKILSLRQVNQSPRRLTVVFTELQDLTRSRQFDYNIFLERLKTEIAEKGGDRIAIVTNRETFYRTRNQELDAPRGEREDRPPAANRVQPDFALNGKVMDLVNRGTAFYQFTFSLTDIRSNGGGTEIPIGYDVKVRR
jgi:hypothetical protein